MQHSAKPAIGRWRLSLADRLGDEGRQRGTSLYRACGRGTEIAPSRLRAVASRRHGYLKAQSARCRTRLRESTRRSDRLTRSVSQRQPISDLLGDRNVMRSHTAQAAWREVLGELGWQHDRAAEAEDDLLALLATSRPGAANFQTSTSSADQ